jgi:VanZ family protein
MCNNSAMLQFVRSYWKTILTAIFIAYLMLFKPAGDMQLPPIPFLDKWIHFLLYATLTAVCLFETKKNTHASYIFFIVLLALVFFIVEF